MERLDKFLCGSGAGTRSQVKDILKAGRVTVDGNPEKDGSRKIDPAVHTVTLDGQPLGGKRRMVVMLNKPAGYVTATEDAAEKTVMELLPEAWRHMDLRPVGRLDKATEGLLPFTNDGELANRIMHPASHINKVYRVTVRPDITDEQAAELSAGVKIGENTTTLPATVIVLEKQPGRVVLQITISEGKNRQIRRMCEAVGLEVVRLKRIAVGPIKLGMLQPGRWRDLKSSELIALRGAITKAGGNGAGEGQE